MDQGRLIPTHAGKTTASKLSSRRATAHPHSRGENFACAPTSQASEGSSPLTRGKPPDVSWVETRAGLIPTHAGKTHARDREPHQHEAHPHSRGENIWTAAALKSRAGSSPLTRGKRRVRPSSHSTPGLIPTHAGKTRRRDRRRAAPGAHPHSRGENSDHGPGELAARGSSPLTRGKLNAVPYAGNDLRLIPTHAGKTIALLKPGGVATAHPHSRGENVRASRRV